MDSAFFHAMTIAFSRRVKTYCVLRRDNEVVLCTEPAQVFNSIAEVPNDLFVTGWQNHDGLSGHWSSWKNIETIKNNQASAEDYLNLANYSLGNWKSDLDQKTYVGTVEQMQNRMKEGKYFLANLTRSVKTKANFDPTYIALMSSLYHHTPNRFFYYSKDQSVLGLSPENFIRVSNNQITCEPMKGTSVDSDSLSLNTKELEESTMMIDLTRSELSKVCDAGTIEVINRDEITKHPGLFQMSNKITGRLLDGQDIAKVILTLMPIASVTGTPKPYVIKELASIELEARGLYCGTYGYIDKPNNSCELSVAIRTIHFDQDSTKVGAGAGITVRSRPQLEWEETQLKLEKLTSLCDLSLLEGQSSGAGVFTSTGVFGNRVFRLKEHCERLSANAAEISLEVSAKTIFEQATNYLEAKPRDEYSRLRISISTNGEIKIELIPHLKSDDSLTLGLAWLRSNSVRKNTIKTINRSVYEKALEQAQLCSLQEIDDALLIINNEIIESTRANVFARFGDQAISPTHKDSLSGVLQASVLKEWKSNLELIDSPLILSDLKNCDELVITNSVRGPQNVSRVSFKPLSIDLQFQSESTELKQYLQQEFEKGFS